MNDQIESAVIWALGIATDNSHGYDQAHRWGPDYDCSSLVISAFEHASVPVKSKGAIFTGNMVEVFKACGFEDVTDQINLATGAGLQRGDVLIRHNYKTGDGHTAIALGDGRIVHASGNEWGGATGGTPGDQTGLEICIRSYYNSAPHWDIVLRYASGETSPSVTAKPAPVLVALPEIYESCTGPAVEMLQHSLNFRLRGVSNFAPLDEDGEAGPLTCNAIELFQRLNSLTPDRIAGQQTLRELYGK